MRGRRAAGGVRGGSGQDRRGAPGDRYGTSSGGARPGCRRRTCRRRASTRRSASSNACRAPGGRCWWRSTTSTGRTVTRWPCCRSWAGASGRLRWPCSARCAPGRPTPWSSPTPNGSLPSCWPRRNGGARRRPADLACTHAFTTMRRADLRRVLGAGRAGRHSRRAGSPGGALHGGLPQLPAPAARAPDGERPSDRGPARHLRGHVEDAPGTGLPEGRGPFPPGADSGGLAGAGGCFALTVVEPA